MATTIVLTAVPAHRRRADPAAVVVALFDRKLGMVVVCGETIEALSLLDAFRAEGCRWLALR